MKTRVLLVDDEEVFTRLLKLSLEQNGEYEVRVENWPGGALAAAREFKPHVILLDVIMPQMFGGDVAVQIRAEPDLEKVPIIFLSASLSKSRVEEHEGIIGGYPFLAKPATLQEVVEAIQKQLSSGPTTPVA